MPTYISTTPWWLYAIVVVFGFIGVMYAFSLAMNKYCEMELPTPEENQAIILKNGSEFECGGIEKDMLNGTVRCTHFCEPAQAFMKDDVFVYR